VHFVVVVLAVAGRAQFAVSFDSGSTARLSSNRAVDNVPRSPGFSSAGKNDRLLQHMDDLVIAPATGAERDWAAELLADSEPWITLRVTLQHCRKACRDPEYLLYVAAALAVIAAALWFGVRPSNVQDDQPK
jgi:hypothetical protein